MKSKPKDFEKWLSKGIKHGWISEIVCDTHDGVPITDEESAEMDEGGDPCLPVVRVWGVDGK